MSTRGLCGLSGSETLSSLSEVSDQQLEGGLRELIAKGRRIDAQVVVHLMEVEARRSHLRLGYGSLFQYCLERLELSEYEAFSRINAARMAQKFPRVVELLEQRELNLTTLCLVRDYVSVENQSEIFAEVARKSKREVLLLLARRRPRPDVAARLRKLPGLPGAASGDGALEPLSAVTFRLQMTLNADAKSKLELARDLLSHANPSGDLAVVVERALDALLEKLQRSRFAATGRRPGRASTEIDQTDQTNRSRSPRHAAANAAQNDAGERALGGEGSREECEVVSASGDVATATSEAVAARNETGGARRDVVPARSEAVAARSEAGNARSEAGNASGEVTGGVRDVGGVVRARRRHIPNDVRRRVVARDRSCCAFVGADGLRCGSRVFLQVHHDSVCAGWRRDRRQLAVALCGSQSTAGGERLWTRLGE